VAPLPACRNLFSGWLARGHSFTMQPVGVGDGVHMINRLMMGPDHYANAYSEGPSLGADFHMGTVVRALHQ